MNTAALVAGAAALCVASASIALVALRPAEGESDPRLAERLEAVVSRLEGLERASEEQREALRLFEERLGTETEPVSANEPTPIAAASTPAPTEEAPAFDLAAALRDLRSEELSGAAKSELWEKIRKAGKLDEAVALFEQRAKDEPYDVEAKVELAGAYIQKIFEAGAGPMAGKWALKVDATVNQALELDPNHWEARFTKAISLSNWPAAFGKQGEAIRQFEILLEQQQRSESRPHHAQTYLFLGNMYQAIGQGEKARATWSAGAGLFPNNGELQKQLQLIQGR
jgi:tetratricopeptide (TPR) repeat protein